MQPKEFRVSTSRSAATILIFMVMCTQGIAGPAASNQDIKQGYSPDISVLKRMTPADAIRILPRVLHDQNANAGGNGVKLWKGTVLKIEGELLIDDIDEINVVHNKHLVFVGRNGKRFTIPERLEYISATTCIVSDNVAVQFRWAYYLTYFDAENAKQFVDALFVLQQTAFMDEQAALAEWAAARDKDKIQNETRFKKAAQEYRDAVVKPILSEDAVKLKAQAEEAVREERFIEAANLYAKALDIAPWWAKGHFDHALVLGNMGEYRTAMLEMKRYLRLAPDAPDVRDAREKIKVWDMYLSIRPLD